MNIFIVITIAIILIVVLLRFKTPIGPAILAGGLVIWAFTAPNWHYLVAAAQETVTLPRTYDLIFALYFVMCLEIELRRSKTLDGMVQSLNRLFSSTKITLAIMPAFLGLLPSIGGARFSAPIVETASKGTGISAESKAAINFWFRHVCEFASPIIPGMILACGIANIAVTSLVAHLIWLSVVAVAVGWLVLIRPLRFKEVKEKADNDPAMVRKNFFEISLALSPIIVNVILMMAFDMSAAIAMGLVTLVMIPVLRLCGRPVPVKDVFIGAADWRLILNVGCILYFIQLLTTTGALQQIITAFDGSVLPVPVILAMISFVIGILTGMSQGHVAIVMPIVAGIAPGSLDLAGIAMAFGVAGQMLTPTHVCLMITVDYFKSDFFKTLAPVALMEVILLTIFSIVTYFTWG